jgi:thymidylate synthase (FAD)
VKFQFSVHCPLFVRGQWHRHRAGWSYNEISRRYTEVDMEFYIPENFRIQSDNNKQASVENSQIENNKEACEQYNKIVSDCYSAYEKLLELGVCKEQARGVLPQTMFTTFWATVDLRNLLHFIELRDDEHAQKEIREYAKAMKELIRPYVPHVVEYFENKK